MNKIDIVAFGFPDLVKGLAELIKVDLAIE